MPDDETYPQPPSMPETSEMPMYEQTLGTYAGENMASIKAAVQHRPTVTEQLLHRKAHLEAELAQVNAALAQAEANQPTMKLLDSIAKVGLHR